jgi:hypothetical protein
LFRRRRHLSAVNFLVDMGASVEDKHRVEMLILLYAITAFIAMIMKLFGKSIYRDRLYTTLYSYSI